MSPTVSAVDRIAAIVASAGEPVPSTRRFPYVHEPMLAVSDETFVHFLAVHVKLAYHGPTHTPQHMIGASI